MTPSTIIVILTATAFIAVVVVFVQLIRQIRQTTQHTPEVIARLEARVEALTSQLNHRMGDVTNSTTHLGTSVQQQLQHANTALTGLADQLGRLDEATRHVQRVGESIHGLEQLLASPKLRGNFGEWTLESLLGEALPQSLFETQYRLNGRGVIADAIVRTASDRIIAIDSKFPIDAFRRYTDALQTDPDASRAEFERSVRTRVDEIARKYISPDDGTLDMALMFVPAESVYYEIAVKHDSPLLEYAHARRVIFCSPNTLYAFLQAVVFGMRGSALPTDAAAVRDMIEHLRQEIAEAASCLTIAVQQTRHTTANIEGAHSALVRAQDRLSAGPDGRQDPANP